MDFFQALIAFILALGILITFHEFGHFWVARLCDVKILRFSVGFGRPLWKRYFSEDNSEFVIAALPLGGYVKMLDEREGEISPEERHRAFNNKPLKQRLAIVVAGPLFNFIFAIFAYWIIYMIGITGLKPITEAITDGSLADQSGIQAGDEIIRVNNYATPTWSAVVEHFIAKVVEEKEANFTVRSKNGEERQHYIDLSKISIDEMASGRLLTALGIQPKRPIIPAVIGEVVADGAAKRAGLQSGDKLLAVNGVSIRDWKEWVDIIRDKPDTELKVEISRSSEYLTVTLIPDAITTENGEKIGRIGAIVDDNYPVDKSLVGVESYSIFPAFVKAIVKTADMSVMTLQILGKMIVGKASVKNLSGPISIAQYAGYTVSLGITAFLSFLAIVSISLGVLNLLPIPILDGGHILYYLVEFIKGSPVSEGAQLVGQQIGLTILIGLMGLAFYNDILRLMG